MSECRFFTAVAVQIFVVHLASIISKPYFAKWLKAGLNEAFKPEDATNGKMDGRSGSEFELTVDDQKVVMIRMIWDHLFFFVKLKQVKCNGSVSFGLNSSYFHLTEFSLGMNWMPKSKKI